MRIAHMSDLHYAPKTIDEVDRCFSFSVDAAIEKQCECAVVSGDLFDHRVDLHSPAVDAILNRVHKLAEHMPVLILQGTYSHDVPGSLDVFRHLGATHEVFVADGVCQVGLISAGGASRFISSVSWFMEEKIDGFKALFSCLPSINKACVAATSAQNASEAVGEHVSNLMRAWSVPNLSARANNIPTIVVSHGTISGCLTEHNVPMAGLDHEFSTGSLFSSEASAVMVGHIHKHQVWRHDGRVIAYPGSIGRLHFGEMDPKGFLIWNIDAKSAAIEFVETPAKRLLEIEFTGAPDMDELAKFSENSAGAHVRVRYTLDEDHRNSVDRDAISALFKNASEIKIEPHINPIQRTRSQGMNRAATLSEKLGKWCQVTTTESAPLQERLAVLAHTDPSKIVESIAKDEPPKQEKAA